MKSEKAPIKSDASLRGKVRAIAKEHDLRPQEVLQMYLFEHLLIRLEASPYAGKFVLKGGLLIASMIGLAQRTTMDMDTTVRSLSMDKHEAEKTIRQICAVDPGDGMTYAFERLEPIREEDEYANWRAHLRVSFGRMDAPIKVDITTGDIVTPGSITYDYPLMFEGGTLSVPAYPLETVLAEKLETCIRRGIANTRGRDYYDLWALLRTRGDQIEPAALRAALRATARKRGSAELLPSYSDILTEVQHSSIMKDIWASYTEATPYAGGISFDEVVETAFTLGKLAIDQ